MELLTAPSKISQVSSHLRKMIKKNYMPGSKLFSTRQLAKQFQVSPKTVKCALDVLQQERLIRCEHGRGIFIEQQAHNEEIEVYILLWGMRREPCNYFEQIIKIAYPPALKTGFSFIVRTVFKDSDDFNHFDQELARIENSPNIKCVLTGASQYNVEHFEKLNNLSCPVVFFGDTKYEEATDFPRNQLIDNSDWTVACMALLEYLQEREVSLFIPDGSIAFFKEFTRHLVMETSQAGIKLNLFEIPCSVFGEIDHDTVSNVYARYIKKAQQDGQLECPVIMYGMIKSVFLESPAIQKRLQSKTPFIQPQLSSTNMTPFYNAVFELIESVISNPADIQSRTICNPVLLNDLSNSQKYLFKNEVIEKV